MYTYSHLALIKPSHGVDMATIWQVGKGNENSQLATHSLGEDVTSGVIFEFLDYLKFRIEIDLYVRKCCLWYYFLPKKKMPDFECRVYFLNKSKIHDIKI